MWCRDTQDEADRIEAWQDELDEVMKNVPVQPSIPISWDDPKLIRQTTERLKPYKAPGIYGWRAQ